MADPEAKHFREWSEGAKKGHAHTSFGDDAGFEDKGVYKQDYPKYDVQQVTTPDERLAVANKARAQTFQFNDGTSSTFTTSSQSSYKKPGTEAPQSKQPTHVTDQGTSDTYKTTSSQSYISHVKSQEKIPAAGAAKENLQKSHFSFNENAGGEDDAPRTQGKRTGQGKDDPHRTTLQLGIDNNDPVAKQGRGRGVAHKEQGIFGPDEADSNSRFQTTTNSSYKKH
ncbi:MAG: hypothetical protein EZS28_038008 [Streblomastix strix]|uniref:Uncharacterized protein n=1 Tax=Streblomastix strix TaxID=222440 RepID=A0A5J4U6J0_9EUKA|nr:MAG: hypothetical protein EZS28_038008 [Streblomastix strix]